MLQRPFSIEIWTGQFKIKIPINLHYFDKSMSLDQEIYVIIRSWVKGTLFDLI